MHAVIQDKRDRRMRGVHLTDRSTAVKVLVANLAVRWLPPRGPLPDNVDFSQLLSDRNAPYAFEFIAKANAVVEDAIMATRASVEEGKTIAEPLKAAKVFPPMVVQMISIGEQTGALDTMLAKIADFYEDEVDEATANLLALLEPVMICFLGVVIGGIVI